MENKVRKATVYIVGAIGIVVYWLVYFPCVLYQSVKTATSNGSGDANNNWSFWIEGCGIWGDE